jgi:hypothetical protein
LSGKAGWNRLFINGDIKTMTRRCQFALVFASAIALGAIVSHATAKWVGIDTRQGDAGTYGKDLNGPPAVCAGSSTIGVAVDWDAVAADLSRPIASAATASASPCELDALTLAAPKADLIFVGTSAYELDEYYLADFRAEIVPIGQTVSDLWNSHSDWPFIKRTVSRYPLSWLQELFPSAGRAMGIMVGLRTKLAKLAGRPDIDPLPKLHTGNDAPRARVTDWPEARLLRNVSEMRAGCRGQHGFNGPKRLAFDRMLDRLTRQGRVIVLVLPVSPQYETGLLTSADRAAFADELTSLARNHPAVTWLRYDQMPELQTSDDFSDLLH